MPRAGLSRLSQPSDDLCHNDIEQLWRLRLGSFHYDSSPPPDSYLKHSNEFLNRLSPASQFAELHSDSGKSNKLAFSLNSLAHPNGSLYFGIGHCLYEVPLHRDQTKVASCNASSANEDGRDLQPEDQCKPRCVCVLQPCDVLPSTKFLCMFRICSSPDGSLFVLLSHAFTTGSSTANQGDSTQNSEPLGEDVEENRLFHVRLDGSFSEVALPSRDVNYIAVWQKNCLVVSSTMAWDSAEQSPPVWILKRVSSGGWFGGSCVVDRWVSRPVSIDLKPDPPIYLLVQDTLPDGEILLMVERELQTDGGRSHTEIYKCRVELDSPKSCIPTDHFEVDASGTFTPLSSWDSSPFNTQLTPTCRSVKAGRRVLTSTPKANRFRQIAGGRMYATRIFSHSYLEKVIKSSLPINHIIASHSGCIYCYDLSSAYVDSVWQLGFSEGMTDLTCIRGVAKFHSSDYSYRGRCSAATPAGEFMVSVELCVGGEGEREILVSRQPLKPLRCSEAVGSPCPEMFQKPWADVHFRTVDDGIVDAHRVVLATRCDYFWKMLTSPMQEGKNEIREIVVPYTKAAVKCLVRYLYCEEFDCPSFASLLELTVMADYFCIPSVAEKAFTLLMDSLSPATSIDLYTAASAFSCGTGRVAVVQLHAAHLIAHNLPSMMKNRSAELWKILKDAPRSAILRQVLCERSEHRLELCHKLQELAKSPECNFHDALIDFLVELRLKDSAIERKGWKY